MKSSIITLISAAVFLCLVAFPTTTVGTWPKPIQGWPHPSKISRNEMLFSTSHRFNYEDSKVWKCTYSNGSDPAISISNPSPPSTPSTPSPSTPPPTPKTSPPPPTPSPPPPTPSPPPPTPKMSPPAPPAPKMSPPPSKPSPTPKTSPKKGPSPPPPVVSEQPFNPNPNPNPPREHHHSHHHNHHEQHENGWEHFLRCMRNMGPVGTCRRQMSISYYTRMFGVSDYCCNLLVNMNNECDDVAWGFFTDPYFLPLLRCTCHVNL